jgi:nitric oxide dioxygenase
LISAGIGITPMISMLEYFAEQAPHLPARVLHADSGDKTHPLRDRRGVSVWQQRIVQAVRTQLADRDVAPGRVHCELFSLNDWLLNYRRSVQQAGQRVLDNPKMLGHGRSSA